MKYGKIELEEYGKYLKNIALLSRLFSESETPYIHYRTTEYLYCKLFKADNISRSDVTIDAKNKKLGIGIKTFTYTGKRSQEKIAEFNEALKEFSSLDDLNKVKKVSELRNKRIELVERLFNVDETIYHCIGRKNGKIFVFETPMHKINLEEIKITKNFRSQNVINFEDGLDNYSFNVSKSTLYKYFEATKDNTVLEIEIDMLTDPLESIKKLLEDKIVKTKTNNHRVVLPLYSYNSDRQPHVFEKSGLNRWNANGEKRKRRYGEAEIGIRSDIRELVHSILPPRNKPFAAVLPNGHEMLLKVSQDDGKALMSNPETALGEWLLSEVLDLKDNEVLTYSRLIELGIDSVELSYREGVWYMNFCEVGSFEKFLIENS